MKYTLYNGYLQSSGHVKSVCISTDCVARLVAETAVCTKTRESGRVDIYMLIIFDILILYVEHSLYW